MLKIASNRWQLLRFTGAAFHCDIWKKKFIFVPIKTMEGIADSKQLEIPNESDFMRFYSKLEDKSDATIRFFCYGDFYTVHGSDAQLIAETILNTNSVIRYIGHSKLASLSVNANKFNGIVKELILVRCYRVEVYEKNEKWSLKIKSSPGNLGELEDIVYSDFEAQDSRGLIAVKINCNDEVHVGLSFVDNIERFINVFEFEDNQYLTLFEALLVQLGPKECLLSQDCESLTCFQRLKSIILMNNILLTSVKAQDFKIKVTEDEIKNLKKLLHKKANNTEYLEDYKLGLSALSASVKFLNLMQSHNFGQFFLNRLDTKSIVRLDSSAINALNLFSTSKNNTNNKSIDSIYALLNYCKTAPGQRLLAQWIRQPLTNVHKIEERLNLVECFVNDAAVRDTLNNSFLRRIHDLMRLSKKLHCKKASLTDCFRISLAIDSSEFMSKNLRNLNNNCVNEVILEPLDVVLQELSSLNKLVDDTIMYEDVMKGPIIKPSFNQSLTEESKKMENSVNKAHHICSKIAKDLKLEIGKGLKMECNDSIGFFLKVTKKEEKTLRDKRNYILVEKARKDGVRFLNRDLQALNEDYLNIRRRYESLQKEVLTQIINEAAKYSDHVRNLGYILATLDVVVALAIAAVKADIPFVKPKVTSKESGKIVLKQVRHPCVEVKHSVSYIPNDVEFENQKFFLVTGPNMGGKSTYIRSVGLCVLMAQIGSFVPAESATVSVVDGIYTRIGASDKQIKGYSTFMMEMIETNSILRSATKNSLVIIDELGRGTSTYEGFGLAWSISEHIAKQIQAYCLFATHFHELTELSKAISTIGNLHLSALTSEGKLTFMYEVKKGSCDQSFGIHVAELAKFPKHMIELSKKKVNELEGFPLSGDSEKSVVNEIKKFDVDMATDEEVLAFVAKLKTKYLPQ